MLYILAVLVFSGPAWGKTFSLDLRGSRTGSGSSARLMSTFSPATARRTVSLDAGVTDVGAVTVGDRLSLKMFDDVLLTLTLVRRMPSPLGGDVFLAELDGYGGMKSAVVLRTGAGLTFDVQDTLKGKVYRVVATAAGVTVEESFQEAGRKCGCCSGTHPQAIQEGSCKTPKLLAASPSAPVEEADKDIVVDMLVAYDMGAARWIEGNGGDITNFAQVAVQKMNLALANTDLDAFFTFRLVGVWLEDGVQSTDIDRTLEEATRCTGSWRNSRIRAARDEVGADIVSILIDTGSAYGMVGLAWSLEKQNSSQFSEYAYNVCSVRSVAESHTMTHETGHNLGAGHSDEMADVGSRGPQYYYYSSGYYFSGPCIEQTVDDSGATALTETEDFCGHTIMSYDAYIGGERYVEVPFFSSPDHHYGIHVDGMADLPVGDATHDNTRTIRNNYALASQWRERKVLLEWEVAFSPASGTVIDGGQTVELSNGLGLEMRYTLDGSEPSADSPLYTGPIILTDSATVRAAVVNEDGVLLKPMTAEYYKGSDTLAWETGRDAALGRAWNEGKRVLLVSGTDASNDTMYTKRVACEDGSVRERLSMDFVLWYNDCDAQSGDVSRYLGGLSSMEQPLVCVIDPYGANGSYIVRSAGRLSSAGMQSLLDGLPEWSRPSLLKVYQAGGDATCKVAGTGAYAVGKKVTIRATPGRGFAFSGWYEDADCGTPCAALGVDFRTASVSYVVTEDDRELYARFVTVEEDSCISLGNADAVYAACGETTIALDVSSLSLPKVTLKGLPKGLSFNAKTLMVSGRPTKPGVYVVTASMSNASVKKAVTATFTVVVPNLKDEEIPVEDSYGAYIPGKVYSENIPAAEGCSVSGLPSGMKWVDPQVVGAASKPGTYTVYFTKKTDNVTHTATATMTVSDFPALSVDSCGTGSGKVTGAGAYAANKKVSLKAVPNAGSVFMGWSDASGAPISQSANFSMVMPEHDTAIMARFITAEEDAANVGLSIDGTTLSSSPAEVQARTVVCGVNLEWPVAVSAMSATSVKVTGLPSGLKFTSKEVVDSKTKRVLAHANSIYGAPSAASKANAMTGEVAPSQVKVAVTTAGKTTVEYAMAITVEALPAWAVGNFEGYAGASDTSCAGPVSMSVSSSGKISGKVALGGTNWTFKSDSYASIRAPAVLRAASTSSAAYGSEIFVVYATATAGKESRDLSLEVAQSAFADLPYSAMARAGCTFGGYFVELCRLPWTDKSDTAPKTWLSSFTGSYSCKIPYGDTEVSATFTLDEKGVAKGSVALPDGIKTRTATFSAGALAMDDAVYVAVAVPPDLKTGFPQVFSLRELVPHASADGDPSVAYRDPGVITCIGTAATVSGASGTVSVKPKYGQAAAGKDVSLTAKADKGSVFSRWIVQGAEVAEADATSPTVKFKMAACGDVYVTAQFVTAEEDSRAVQLSVDGTLLHGSINDLGLLNEPWRCPCGVAVDWPVIPGGLSKLTVKASGLPAGLKLVQDKATGAYSIAGVPTAASKVDAKTGEAVPSTAKFAVTTAGKFTETFLLDIFVDAMPQDMVGTYTGIVGGWSAKSTTERRAYGMLSSLTVAANGKISAKAELPSGKYAFSAPGWNSENGGKYAVEMATKTGDRLFIELDGSCDWRTARIGGGSKLEIAGETAANAVIAWRNEHVKSGKIATDAKAADAVSRIVDLGKLHFAVVENADGGYSVAETDPADKSADLTVSFARGGTVKCSGKVGGLSVSGSTTLNVIDDQYNMACDLAVPFGNDGALHLSLVFSPGEDGEPRPDLRVQRVMR